MMACQSYPLPVAFGEFADQLGAHVGHRAALGYFVHAPRDIRGGDAFQATHEGQVLGDLHLGIEWRGLGQVSDALLHLHGVLQHVESGHGGFAFCGW